MPDKSSVTRLKAAFRPVTIALTTTTLCVIVTYRTSQHANDDGARMQWVILCLIAVIFYVVILPTFILRTASQRRGENAKEFPKDDSTTDEAMPESKPSARPADEPWWQEVFAKFDADERGLTTLSIIGLVLGPLYYFILRMWRKGLAIIGIALCAIAVLDLLHVLLGLPPSVQTVVGFAMGAFCMFMVKRDYYMLKRHDEIMWPQIKWLNSRVVLAGLIVVPLLVEVVRGAVVDPEDTPTRASTCSACGTEKPRPLAITTALTGSVAARTNGASRVDN